MKVIDLINGSKTTAFSFEILPPLKGNSIQKVYNVIDKLKEFDPKYINITSHHSEYIYKTLPDGSFQKVRVRLPLLLPSRTNMVFRQFHILYVRDLQKMKRNMR